MKKILLFVVVMSGCAHPERIGCAEQAGAVLTDNGKRQRIMLCHWTDGSVTWMGGAEVRP